MVYVKRHAKTQQQPLVTAGRFTKVETSRLADDSMARKTGRRTFENPDGGSKVVDSSGGLEGSGDDRGRGHEIVGKGVVEVALKYDLSKSYDIWGGEVGWSWRYLELEDVLHGIKLLLESANLTSFWSANQLRKQQLFRRATMQHEREVVVVVVVGDWGRLALFVDRS